jgi:hypothetical protein
MQSVPKIVLDRLKAGPPALSHPDADVLTAFSEQALPDREREQVLEHLARCGDCREVLALALPEPDMGQVVAGSAVSGWFRWPILRWGFVAAGVGIVAIGVVQYQRRANISMMVARSAAVPMAGNAGRESQTTPVLPEASKEPQRLEKGVGNASSNESPTDRAGKSDSQTETAGRLTATPILKSAPKEDVPIARPSAPGSLTVRGQNIAALPHGPRMTQNQISQNQSDQNQINRYQQDTIALAAPPYPPPPSAVGGPIHGDAVPVAAGQPGSQAQVSQSQTVQSQTVQSQTVQSQTIQSEGVKVEPAQAQTAVAGGNFSDLQPLQNQRLDQRSQDAGSAESKVDNKPIDGLVAGNSSKVLKAASPKADAYARGATPSWTIGSTGNLQRSFDQGHTWQDVNVNGNPAPATAVGAMLTSGAAAAERDNKEKSAATAPALKDEFAKKAYGAPIVFRAVSANGAEVWAGGAAALLYHSSDSGSHWTRIVPVDGNATLTGDVVAVEFSDSQNGKVSTSSPEVWTTADGGQTWQKQ